jgi:bifunctional DNA-binding transcriptional regulator/antitoxin component of YhaV-PrlF toxin-antitoxin module
MQAKVQQCGCIAIPEELVEKTGLRPGARFEMTLAPDGKGIVVVASESEPVPEIVPFAGGTTCG